MKYGRHWILILFLILSWTTARAESESREAQRRDSESIQRIEDIEAYFLNAQPPTSIARSSEARKPGPLAAIAGPGHNAWMMISSAMVLFMTLPGLALFYGGLVRTKNVLSVLAQCMGIAGLVALLWWAVGYSLIFGKNFNNPFFGGSEFFFLKNVGPAPNTDYAYWVSHHIFSMYELMFAIITPALILGAIAERTKFSTILVFVAGWMFLVYFPLAHMVWGSTGFMNGIWNPQAVVRAVDFAGGTVVHMSSGWSALILCLLVGKRMGFGKDPMPPHSMVLCMIGTGMLWVGWYGFNAGSALAADGIATNAFMTTTLAAAVASFSWAMAEYGIRGRPSVLGFCSGVVSGLVVITPACGFVDANGAVVIGLLAGLIPFFACTKMKKLFGYDDALDTFGIHGVGGTIGALLTGFLATASVNPNLVGEPARQNGLASLLRHGLWFEQMKAILLTVGMATLATLLLVLVIKAVVGLRPTDDVERQGLDLNEHGEVGYDY